MAERSASRGHVQSKSASVEGADACVAQAARKAPAAAFVFLDLEKARGAGVVGDVGERGEEAEEAEEAEAAEARSTAKFDLCSRQRGKVALQYNQLGGGRRTLACDDRVDVPPEAVT